MDLKYYLAMLWRNKWVIIITTIVTVGVVATLTYLMTPTYTAKATLRVATAANASVSYTDYMYADRLMNTYVKLATSSPILTELTEKLGITKPPEIKVTTVPNTELIQITVQSSNPALAQQAANTLGDILVTQSKDLYSGTGKDTLQILTEQLALAESELKQARQDLEALVGTQSMDEEVIGAANSMIQLKEKTYASLLEEYEQARLRDALRENTISVVEPAAMPISPSQPRKVTNIALGIVVGVCGGIGLAFVMENLNTHLYTTRQIESTTGMKLLSKIPRVSRKQLLPSKNGHQSGDDPIHEAIRRLRTNVLAQSTNGSSGASSHTFLITSSEPGEGKTTIAVHLAAAMAQYYHKVVLVDTDMRLPSVHKALGLANTKGLSNILRLKAFAGDVVQPTFLSGLSVITSGPKPSNPSELLGSRRMETLIEELTNLYDIVVLDSPAFMSVADASELAPMADKVVLVVRRNKVRQEALRETCKHLKDLNITPVGIVVNDAEHSSSYYYYHRN